MGRKETKKEGLLLDLHTHHSAPQPGGIISLDATEMPEVSSLLPDQLYSVGIHPWSTMEDPGEEVWARLEELAALPNVVAIGEAGIDMSGKGGPLFRQLLVFRRQVELSERLCKPMVIHDVKAHDVLTGCSRDLNPKQNWAIHGFRLKPQVAEMLLRAGFWLSFGAEFNHETLRDMPEGRMLAETDESELGIADVIKRLSAVLDRDVTEEIGRNTRNFLRAAGSDCQSAVNKENNLITESI